MFDLVLNSFFASIPVFIFFGIGFWLRYKKAIAPEHDSVILQLAMDVGYPCLIFHSIMKYMVVEANPVMSTFGFSLQGILCGFLELLVGVLAAYAVAWVLRLKIGTGLRTRRPHAGCALHSQHGLRNLHLESGGHPHVRRGEGSAHRHAAARAAAGCGGLAHHCLGGAG